MFEWSGPLPPHLDSEKTKTSFVQWALYSNGRSVTQNNRDRLPWQTHLKHGAVYSQAFFPRSFSRYISSSGFRWALYHSKSTRNVYFDFYYDYHGNWLDISFSFAKTSAYHRNLIANVDRINSKKISYPRFYTCCKKIILEQTGNLKIFMHM